MDHHKRTQILHVLILHHLENASLLALSDLCPVRLAHHNTVRHSSGDKRSAIAELGPARVEVECDVAQAVAESAEEEGKVADEPRELQRGGKRCQALR